MNVIITGASRGIGYELVKQFAGDGAHHIYAVSRNLGHLEKLQKECFKQFPNAFLLMHKIYLRKYLIPSKLSRNHLYQ